MLDAETFDELNNLLEVERAEPFDKYFSVMDITRTQKEERIDLAEDMYDKFLFVMALLFAMQKQGYIEYEIVVEKFYELYIEAVSGYMDIDSYIDGYVRQLSNDMVTSTINHIEEPYYFSADRAKVYAEEESNTSLNYKDFVEAVKKGFTKKRWIDVKDNRERKSHLKVGGTVKPILDPFQVGEALMQFPKDLSLNAIDYPEQYVNCRCSIKYF